MLAIEAGTRAVPGWLACRDDRVTVPRAHERRTRPAGETEQSELMVCGRVWWCLRHMHMHTHTHRYYILAWRS